MLPPVYHPPADADTIAPMTTHLDITDPRYADADASILRRHDNFEAEANITTAVRDFLVLTGLANGDEIIGKNPPTDASRRAV